MKKLQLKKSINLNRGEMGFIPLIAVAMIVFVVTVAVYFVANYVAESYVDDTRLSNWGYLYSDSPGAIPEGEVRIYNAQNPILTESAVRKDYLYFTKTLEPSETADKLIIKTDFSPMMIKVNGREVYNNRYDSAEYVGNCYNATIIEASTQDRQIEVFIKVPLSVRFEAFLSPESSPAFTPTFGFIVGAVMAGIGVLALIVFALLSIIKKKLFHTVFVSVIFTYAGGAVLLHYLPEVTYLINAPVWMRLTIVPVHLTFLLTLFGFNHYFKNHKKTTVAVIAVSAISTLAVMLSFTPTLVRISSGVMCLLTFATIVYSAYLSLSQLGRRMQHSVPIFVMNAYYAMTALLAAFLLLFRQRNLYIFTVAIPTVVLLSVMEYIYISEYRFKLKNSELSEHSHRYTEEVDYISHFIGNMLHLSQGEDFYEKTVEEMLALLANHRPENADAHCCVAEKDGDSYREIINRGVGRCDYSVIEMNSRKSDKDCLVSETFFEYILKKDGDIGAIFHFENIKGGLDILFISILEAAYCGVESAYKNRYASAKESDVNLLLAELAENAELENGATVDHISHIYVHTQALCKELGIESERAEQIAVASKLHDLGKIAVPKYIIDKQGMLNEEERLAVRSHTEFGYKILSSFDDEVLKTAATIARYHHERVDGSGYNGLRGEEIPLEAKIVTVCDVYDALISERAYKKAWSSEDAIAYLTENEGKIFDRRVCSAFISYINRT